MWPSKQTRADEDARRPIHLVEQARQDLEVVERPVVERDRAGTRWRVSVLEQLGER